MGKFILEDLLNENISPMMKQYIELKLKNKDKIIFYRLGDFYEMFFDDAILTSKLLELTLTGRDCGLTERAPMCGVPHHSVSGYIGKLTSLGYKVAICEQVEDPKDKKGIVKREIVRVITPGTVTDTDVLSEKSNNFLCSVYGDEKGVCMVFSDVSTGELDIINPIMESEYAYKIISELSKYSPKEILINKKLAQNEKLLREISIRYSPYINSIDEEDYDNDNGIKIIKSKFTDYELGKTNILNYKQSVNALSKMIEYLCETQFNELKHVSKFECYNEEDFAHIDISTKRNLELTGTLRDNNKQGSLIGILDKTSTSMGARLLKQYIEMPLKSYVHIALRHGAVEELLEKREVREEIIKKLDFVYDIERLASRVSYKSANGRDLVALRKSFGCVPEIRSILSKCTSTLLKEIYEELDPLTDGVDILDRALNEAQPLSVKEGGLIKDGYNEKLDELRRAMREGKEWILQIENQEREKTGIKNLKISFNKVFGYYIEVTKSYLNMVPDYFMRKQTLANCERYITSKLKDIESLVIGPEDKSINLESELFTEISDEMYKTSQRIQKTAKALAKLDVLCSFATVAFKNHYVKPTLSSDGKIIIKEGRHPVVEKVVTTGAFIPNDTYLDMNDNIFSIITGPNMAGKSTYMRQVALITLMSQIGSFVPARSATLPVVDKIFTRVGASDDLASGQSTFMVEMSEVSNILKNATKDSLVILDEIGRGTSTFDGLSIAWSVVEYIIKKIGAKTLFATHYHELTVLEEKLKGVKNYQVAVKKRGDDITFLRKIIEGGTDDSYGIEVALLAGVPNDVVKRAREIVKVLESKELAIDEITLKNMPEPKKEDDTQIGFVNMANDNIVKTLKGIDVTTLTPVEALNILYDLSNKVKEL